MKPTKAEEEQVQNWFKSEFWPLYPSSFCRSGKGSRAKAMISMVKYNPDKDEQTRIMGNLKAQIKSDRSNPDRLYWSIGLTYVNNRMWDDEIESATEIKERQIAKKCNVDGCHNDVHGDMYTQCSQHMPNNFDGKLRAAWKKTGLNRKSPNLAEECRTYCKNRGYLI